MPPPPRAPVTTPEAVVDLAERWTPPIVYTVALCMAVAAFGSGLFAATGMRSHAGQDPSNLTWTRILGVAEAVEGFRTEHGDWPADLAELLDDGLDDDELPLDGWICELRYARTDSGGAVIYSLGGDRRPGGLGQDADLAWFLAAPSLDQD